MEKVLSLFLTIACTFIFAQVDSSKGFARISDTVILVDLIKNTQGKQNWFVRDSLSKEKFAVDTNSIFIKFTSLPAKDSILRLGQRHGLTFNRITLANWVDFQVPDSVNYYRCLEQLEKIDNSIIDQSFEIKLHGSITPNDPNFSAQWGLKKINIEQAWDINTGDPSVTVAVIDAGINWSDELGDGADGYNNWFFNLQEDV